MNQQQKRTRETRQPIAFHRLADGCQFRRGDDLQTWEKFQSMFAWRVSPSVKDGPVYEIVDRDEMIRPF